MSAPPTNALATLAKRAAADKAVAAPQRGRWIHHMGEETVDENLEVYYCSYCGAHSLILDVLISELPARNSDRARVVHLTRHAAQLLLDEGPCVKLKRSPGVAGGPPLVEKQYRYVCKGCALPLAYLAHPFHDVANKYLYLIEGAFSLTGEGKTRAQLEEEESRERALQSLAPIIIPSFAVTKPSAAALAAAAAASAKEAAKEAAASSAAAAASSSADSATATIAVKTEPAAPATVKTEAAPPVTVKSEPADSSASSADASKA